MIFFRLLLLWAICVVAQQVLVTTTCKSQVTMIGCTSISANCCLNGGMGVALATVDARHCVWNATMHTCSCSTCAGAVSDVSCARCYKTATGACSRCRPDDKPVYFWTISKSPENCIGCENTVCSPQPLVCAPPATGPVKPPMPTIEPLGGGGGSGGSGSSTTAPSCPAVNCQSHWEDWGPCFVAPSTGQCMRQRSLVVDIQPQCGGLACTTENEMEVTDGLCCKNVQQPGTTSLTTMEVPTSPPPTTTKPIATTTTTTSTRTVTTPTTAARPAENGGDATTAADSTTFDCNDTNSMSCAQCAQQAQCRWCGNRGRCLRFNSVAECQAWVPVCSDAPNRITLFAKDFVDAPRNVSLGNSTVTATFKVVSLVTGRQKAFQWTFEPAVTIQSLSLSNFDTQTERGFLNVSRNDGVSHAINIYEPVTDLLGFTAGGVSIVQLDAVLDAEFGVESLEIATPTPPRDDGADGWILINDPDEPAADNALAIGLGVGLGLLALLLAIVAVVAIQRKRQSAATAHTEPISAAATTYATAPATMTHEYGRITTVAPSQYSGFGQSASPTSHYDGVHDPLVK